MPNNEKSAKNTKSEEQEIILQHQRRRRRHKIKLALISTILIVIAVSFITTYFRLSKNEYNTYMERAEVEYKVNLFENEFYQQNYTQEGTNVVASLIKDIEIDFNYNLDLGFEQEYSYRYEILAKTNVREGSRANSVYETSEELLSRATQNGKQRNLAISEKVVIDYNEYNEKINKFISIYNLSNTTNTLDLEMYVYVTNKYDGKQINKESKVMTLSIPLTTKTVEISIDSNVVQDQGRILSKKTEYDNINYVLAVGCGLLALGLIVFALLVKYILDNRRAETMYRQELKKILFNYKSYLQQTNNEVEYNNYKVIQINTFNEILSMRDTMQAPILMYTEKDEERTKFMIIQDDILYLYVLGAKEIRKELIAKSEMQKAKKAEKTENK